MALWKFWATSYQIAIIKCLELQINNPDRVICQFTGIFIAETSHASVRRILGSFQNIGVSFGCLLSYTTTAFLPWRMCKLIVSLVVILPSAFAILLCEETPHWLVKKGRIDQARYVGRFLSISKDQQFIRIRIILFKEIHGLLQRQGMSLSRDWIAINCREWSK